MLDFQRIYLTKLECRPSLKFLQTFIIIGDGMALCHCISPSSSSTNSSHSLYPFTCHVRVSEWIHTLYLLECQETP